MMEDTRSWTSANSLGHRPRGPVDASWLNDRTLSRRSRGSRRRRRREKALGEKVADWFRAFIAFLFSNVGIVCLVVGYTIAGAFIFEAIEGSHNIKIDYGYDVPSSRNQTAIQMWQLTTKENIFSERLWKSKIDKILQKYQESVVGAVNRGWEGSESNQSTQWSFAGAFLYSLTVITTIGYGNMCPRTMWGKVITIGYAIAGMPLFLLYLSNIGDILAKSFKWTYAHCCLCRCRKRTRVLRDCADQQKSWQMTNLQSGRIDSASLSGEIDSELKTTVSDDENDEDEDEDDDDPYDPQQITVPLTLCLGIMVGYICGGALLFSEWEDWDFLDGSYFCFVSLSTIGFGDIVPGDKIYSGQGIELSFIFCSMYLMLGMALIAMCFNLMQEEVMAKIRSFSRTIKHVFRCDR